MPEVHVIGEILGATDFGKDSLYCKWEIVAGSDKWTELEGVFSGQTQLSIVEGTNKERVVWNHPLDLYYSTTCLQGWPRLNLEVWNEDKFGRNELCGYGVATLPTEPGEHMLECVLWKPRGSAMEQIYNFFFDTASHLEHKQLVGSSEDKFDLFTDTVGSVHIHCDILLRGFGHRGVSFAQM